MESFRRDYDLIDFGLETGAALRELTIGGHNSVAELLDMEPPISAGRESQTGFERSMTARVDLGNVIARRNKGRQRIYG